MPCLATHRTEFGKYHPSPGTARRIQAGHSHRRSSGCPAGTSPIRAGPHEEWENELRTPFSCNPHPTGALTTILVLEHLKPFFSIQLSGDDRTSGVTDSPLFRCEPSDPSTTRARLQAIGMMCRLAEAISVMTVTSHKRLVDHCVRQDMDVQLTDCRRASHVEAARRCMKMLEYEVAR